MEAAYRRTSRRVVLPLALLIVLSSIDRVNISFAALRMNAELGLDPKAYGFGASLFFVGYLLFQLPSMALLARWGARWWIAGSVIGWGSAATAMAFINTREHFYALRFVLGMFESGFAPGVVWYVSQWLPQEYRGRSIGLTLLAIPTSVVIGGPLCGALMTQDFGLIGGWRLMFLVEGLVTIAAGIAAACWFVDRPDQARWLPDVEREWTKRTIAAERAAVGLRAEPEPLLSVLRRLLPWLCAGLWFVLVTASNVIIFWLPTAIKSFGTHDPLVIGLLSALPWLGIGLGMYFNAHHSDRTGERFRHIGAGALLGAAGLTGAALANSGGPAMLFLMVGGLGIGGAQTVFWTVPTRFFADNPKMIATINLVGNLSGVIAPALIGWIIAKTASVSLPVYLLAALLLAGVGLLVAIRQSEKTDHQRNR